MSELEQPPVSRGLLIALGVVVVLALGWFAFTMLTGGEEETPVPVVQRPPGATTPDVVPPGELPTDAEDDSLYPETTEVFAARDPFAQLVSARPAGSTPILDNTPGTGGGTTGGGASGGGASGGGTTGGGTTGGGTSGGGGTTGGGSSAQVGGTEVKLVDVYDADGQERALVTVNGRSYDVAEGDAFAERFRLLDLSGECGTILFGDSRFVLCEGDEIRK